VSGGPRVGTVVLDFGRPEDARRAAASARDPGLEARVLIVENGSSAASAAGHLRLPANLGFAGGMNAGMARLAEEGCDRILLLNSDAVLDPGCLRALAAALDDPSLAAVGPVILRESDGRIESRGVRVDLGRGRVRLEGHGQAATDLSGVVAAEALSGAAMMISRAALERVGPLDEDYFFSFEEIDWCVRARKAGFGLGVVLHARARHAGSQTIGRSSPDRLYYGARNHVRAAEKLEPRRGAARWARRAAILALGFGHALRQRDVPRSSAWRAVLDGSRDAWQGRAGRRDR
jgi:GT2 family glycosyltransferase